MHTLPLRTIVLSGQIYSGWSNCIHCIVKAQCRPLITTRESYITTLFIVRLMTIKFSGRTHSVTRKGHCSPNKALQL